MKRTFTLLIIFFSVSLYAQFVGIENTYSQSFENAYANNKYVPKGILEAIAYTNTRFSPIPANSEHSCTGMPLPFGILGMFNEGHGYFRENGKIVADKANVEVKDILTNVDAEVNAFANAYTTIIIETGSAGKSVEEKMQLLIQFTEIPLHLNLPGNNYAFDSYLYALYSFLNNTEMQNYYGFPNYALDKNVLWTNEQYEVLTAAKVEIDDTEIRTTTGKKYKNSHDLSTGKSADYGPALWTPAASCNYSSRSGTAISAVTIHTVQGSYAGCISWFQNCAAGVSAHYVVRSSDGQVTQMVLEVSKAWHVGTENPYTVGIEHEGYVTVASWYTTAMYNSSAALTSDICTSNGISRLRTGWWPWLATTYYNASSIPGSCVRVKGHQHYPNQTHTDPGVNWDWNRFFKLIHPTPTPTTITTASGPFMDSGGAGNYSDDERTITTIAPAGATNVTVTFSSFNLENTWDYLYIYDGATINSPLIGYYTGTTSPGIVNSTGGALTFEFRSDCATVAPGWNATFTSSGPSGGGGGDSIAPVTSMTVTNTWQTADFDVDFTDGDEAGGSGLKKSYYHVSDFDGTQFTSNTDRGYFRDDFNGTVLHPQWNVQTGLWTYGSGFIEQTDTTISNTNVWGRLKQDLSNVYVYEFTAALRGGGTNRRAGFHFFCDSAQLTNRGVSYFVWLRKDSDLLEFYKVNSSDVFTMVHSTSLVTNINQFYNYKVIYDRIVGNIKVYRDNILVGEYTDPSPIATGDYVSFRSGNSKWKIDNFKVYRSRASNAPKTITVGSPTSDIRYQNPNPSSASGYISSFSTDSANNLSPIVYEEVNVDWTPPTAVTNITDISIFDEDTISSGNLVGGNWSFAADTNSGVSNYYYAVGTSPGATDFIPFTDNWVINSFIDSVSIAYNQWYYISVKAENSAGLTGDTTSSDGFIFLNLGVDDQSIEPLIFPNPAHHTVIIHLEKEIDKLELVDMNGKVVLAKQVQSTQFNLDLPSSIAFGTYTVKLYVENEVYSKKLIIE